MIGVNGTTNYCRMANNSTYCPPVNKFPINGTEAYTVGEPLDLNGVDFLIVAEGDASFARSWVANHTASGEERVAQRILFSDLMGYEQVQKDKEAQENTQFLINLGAQRAYRVDMRTLDTYFPGHRFHRIQGNCPNLPGSYFTIPRTLPPIIDGFFASAAKLQKEGDTLHLTLPQPGEVKDQALYQGHHFGVVEAANETPYVFVARIPFDSKRYSIYGHRSNNLGAPARVSQFSQEFFFIMGPEGSETPPEKVDFEYVELPHGPREGEPFLCNYFTTVSPDRKSLSQLPPMESSPKRRKSESDEDEISQPKAIVREK